MTYMDVVHGVDISEIKSHRSPGAPQNELTASDALVAALRQANPSIQVGKFRRNVQDAIEEDCIAEYCGHDDDHKVAFVKWLQSRYSRKELQEKILIGNGRSLGLSDVAEMWKRRCSIVPDAYLIDPVNRTVVCFEIEDTHPLSRNNMQKYVNIWWVLEAIEWDLVMKAYNVCGDCREIDLLRADAVLLREKYPEFAASSKG